ncbi:MAG: MFS transporter, partial [Thermoplasmata archaeon]|nr:MFS transporter [Thermoplasmata archaeon]
PSTRHALDPARQRGVLIILSAAALMVTYVETMIIPGIGSFETFYGSPLTTVSWILSSYLLVGVAFTPIAGKLGDIYGKKRVLVGLLAVYFVAVTFAGFSPNIGDAVGMSRANELYLLIGIRGVQGVGMAMFPLAFALIGEEFAPERVAQAQSIVSAMFSAGASIGLFGGAWITHNYGWQVTYHTVIPVALIVLVLTLVYLEESRIRLRQSIDVPGSLTLALLLAFFLLALTQGPTWGWGNWQGATLGGVPLGAPEFFLLSAVFLVAFIAVERAARTPIVAFAKLVERNILLANVIGFFAGIGMFMMFVGIVARAEAPVPVGLGKTALDFGYYSLPTTLANMVLAPVIGQSMRRTGPKFPLLLGSALIVLGGLFLAFNNDQPIDLILGPIPIMTGTIAIFIGMINLVVVSSRPEETGIQTGMNLTFRNLGTSIGPVLAATLLASILTVYRAGTPFAFSAPGNLAFEWIFLLIALFGAVAFGLSLLIRNFRFVGRGQKVEANWIGRPTGAGAPGAPVVPGVPTAPPAP